MNPNANQDEWHIRDLRPLMRFRKRPIRPAEIAKGLREAMLERSHMVEDVHYMKIVPNRFVVELNEQNYNENFQPIEGRILAQWRTKLLSDLMTTNSRLGKREYRFGGRVEISLRPNNDLPLDQARILYRVEADESAPEHSSMLSACLESVPPGRRWRLRFGLNTLGRSAANDIQMDQPEIQNRRLVSSQHAYLQCSQEECRLFDGSPQGKPSINGTFVNGQRVPSGGVVLQDGDHILLAAIDPQNPSSDIPGTAPLRFWSNCGTRR